MDCNKCRWLNITEFEQAVKKEKHKCNKYGYRVFHKTNKLDNHDPYLYPCEQCVSDSYKNFIRR